MSKIENMIPRLMTALLTNDKVNSGELRRVLAPDSNPAEFGSAFTRARDALREERGIEFVCAAGRGGDYVRATDAQKVKKALRTHRASRRKGKRALSMVLAASPERLSDEQRRERDATAERLARITLYAETMSRKRKMPPGLGGPES